jgi:hypothetical protein
MLPSMSSQTFLFTKGRQAPNPGPPAGFAGPTQSQIDNLEGVLPKASACRLLYSDLYSSITYVLCVEVVHCIVSHHVINDLNCAERMSFVIFQSSKFTWSSFPRRNRAACAWSTYLWRRTGRFSSYEVSSTSRVTRSRGH